MVCNIPAGTPPLHFRWTFTYFATWPDTTSNTLNNIAYLLSTNPEAQKKLQEEADSVLGPVETRYEMTAKELEERLDEDFVKQFPYTNAIIHESNRLLPVGSLLDGQLTKDLVIDGYYMKKKTTVLAMTRVASLRSCPTPEPFKFKPERWIECTPEQRRLHDKMSWGFVSLLAHREDFVIYLYGSH